MLSLPPAHACPLQPPAQTTFGHGWTKCSGTNGETSDGLAAGRGPKQVCWRRPCHGEELGGHRNAGGSASLVLQRVLAGELECSPTVWMKVPADGQEP